MIPQPIHFEYELFPKHGNRPANGLSNKPNRGNSHPHVQMNMGDRLYNLSNKVTLINS